MKKAITIEATKNCDTRALAAEGKELTKEVVKADTNKHITAVQMCGDFICEKIQEQFALHDHTKLGKNLEAFTAALASKEVGAKFKENPWWATHLTERHHLNDRCPEDVNLIDVLELVCDCVSAGLARTGSVYEISVPTEVLQEALQNTVQMLIDNIQVKED